MFALGRKFLSSFLREQYTGQTKVLLDVLFPLFVTVDGPYGFVTATSEALKVDSQHGITVERRRYVSSGRSFLQEEYKIKGDFLSEKLKEVVVEVVKRVSSKVSFKGSGLVPLRRGNIFFPLVVNYDPFGDSPIIEYASVFSFETPEHLREIFNGKLAEPLQGLYSRSLTGVGKPVIAVLSRGTRESFNGEWIPYDMKPVPFLEKVLEKTLPQLKTVLPERNMKKVLIPVQRIFPVFWKGDPAETLSGLFRKALGSDLKNLSGAVMDSEREGGKKTHTVVSFLGRDSLPIPAVFTSVGDIFPLEVVISLESVAPPETGKTEKDGMFLAAQTDGSNFSIPNVLRSEKFVFTFSVRIAIPEDEEIKKILVGFYGTVPVVSSYELEFPSDLETVLAEMWREKDFLDGFYHIFVRDGTLFFIPLQGTSLRKGTNATEKNGITFVVAEDEINRAGGTLKIYEIFTATDKGKEKRARKMLEKVIRGIVGEADLFLFPQGYSEEV